MQPAPSGVRTGSGGPEKTRLPQKFVGCVARDAAGRCLAEWQQRLMHLSGGLAAACCAALPQQPTGSARGLCGSGGETGDGVSAQCGATQQVARVTPGITDAAVVTSGSAHGPLAGRVFRSLPTAHARSRIGRRLFRPRREALAHAHICARARRARPQGCVCGVPAWGAEAGAGPRRVSLRPRHACGRHHHPSPAGVAVAALAAGLAQPAR